ncbi:CGNR zinc finger domain-containing protein, partial [Streptomyces sp. ZG43]
SRSARTRPGAAPGPPARPRSWPECPRPGTGTAPWHPHLDSDDEAAWGEWLLASSCMALAVLLWDRQLPPGAVCASASCQDVFLTQGGGPTRRYCSRRCATRERVAAHRRARA